MFRAGFTRQARLALIGTTSTYLAVDALRLAIREGKQGKDINAYMEVSDTLHSILPDDPEGVPDLQWVETRTKEVKAQTDKLEAELKAYKNNLIKESIRVSRNHMYYFAWEPDQLTIALV